MDEGLLIAVDRSSSKRVTTYCIVVAEVSSQRVLANLRDKFESIKNLDKYERRTYFTLRLKTINKLISEGHLLELKVLIHAHEVSRILKKYRGKLTIAVIDDKLVKLASEIIPEDFMVPEGKLRHRKVRGVSRRALETLILIADNMANYVRIELSRGRKLHEVLRKISIK